jgi:hypothetical protein
LIKSIIGILKDEQDNQRAERRINETIARYTSAMTENQRKEFAPHEATFKAQIPMYLSEWFRYFVAFDPRATLAKVKVPVLALNGENDLQTAWKENLDLIAEGLKSGGNKDFTVKAFPKLNHLFQTSRTGLLDEYENIEETISPQVLETITEWILKRTSSAK